MVGPGRPLAGPSLCQAQQRLRAPRRAGKPRAPDCWLVSQPLGASCAVSRQQPLSRVLSTACPPGCDASCLRPGISTTRLGSDEPGTPVCVCGWGQEGPPVSAKGLMLSGRKLTEPDPASGSSTPPRTGGPVPLHQEHPAFFTHRPTPEPPREARTRAHRATHPGPRGAPRATTGNREESRQRRGVSPMASDPILSMTPQEKHHHLPGTGPTMPVETR